VSSQSGAVRELGLAYDYGAGLSRRGVFEQGVTVSADAVRELGLA